MKNIQKTKDYPSSNFNEFKYNKYMAIYPFNDKQAFNCWLEINNLTKVEFLSWFDESAQENQINKECPWGKYLNFDYKYNPIKESKYGHNYGVFINFFMQRASDILKVKLNRVNNPHKDNINISEFNVLFKKELSQGLMPIIIPTLTLELNVQRESNNLAGETPEQRNNFYIDLLKTKEFKLKIFQEYPVLFDTLITKTENSIEEHVEFFSRLVKDYSELNQTFGELGKFVNHKGDNGDSHNNGRFVRVCKFQKLNLVYKPRSLKADMTTQQLFKDINKSAFTSFKTIVYKDKGVYGWAEFVKYKKCKSEYEYKTYYSTMGQYVALLYVLNSSDFHFENVIAHGQHPILIDLETIIHSDNSIGAFSQLENIHTVMNSFLLPYITKLVNQDHDFDISTIGFDDVQIMKVANYIGADICEEEKEFAYVDVELKPARKLHYLKNEFGVSIKEIVKLIGNGFRELYKFFQKNRNWLTNNMNFTKLQNLNFRSVVRASNIYGTLINNLLHPDLLRSKEDQMLYLASKLWFLAKNNGKAAPLINYETNCLLCGDIPIFNFSPKSKNIKCGNGFVINSYFDNSTSDKLKFINKRLSNKDLSSQTWLLNTSMNSKQNLKSISNIQIFQTNKAQAQFKVIDEITKKLLTTSIDQGQGYLWNNWTRRNNKFSIGGERCCELFGGNIGSLLYLLYYSKLYKNTKVQTNVDKSINYMIRTFHTNQLTGIGGYTGAGGLVYCLSKIFQLTRNAKILKLITFINSNIISKIKKDESFDIISGSAGCILAMNSVSLTLNDNMFLETSKLCASHILKHFSQLTSGGAWPSKNDKSSYLGGFSHGATGIGYSLARLSTLTSNNKYQKYIDDSIDYEDSLYDIRKNNYLDLRGKDSCIEKHSDFSGWCNGSLGIGLARLDMLINKIQPKRNFQFKAEIKNNINKIMSIGFDTNDSLCHGNAGTLEYLYQVSGHYPHFFSENDFAKIIKKINMRVIKRGVRNGTYFNSFDPALMVGSIGLAFQLLRFKKPQLVKDILLLK